MRIDEVPKEPTHAVKFRNNWDGEGDIEHHLAFKVGDEFYLWETGKPFLEYEGDEILVVWELSDKNCEHNHGH